jgi:hypothetical protein
MVAAQLIAPLLHQAGRVRGKNIWLQMNTNAPRVVSTSARVTGILRECRAVRLLTGGFKLA